MLVSVSDLVTYMDISFSLRQQDAAETVLSGLQSELETYLRRPIEVQEFSEEYTVPAEHLAMPMSSFFYQKNFESSFYTYNGNATQSATNYAMPPETVYLRNSPVSKVLSVSIRNQWSTPRYLSEALKRVAQISNISSVGPTMVVTAANHGFTIGQYVSITGMAEDQYNVSNKQIVDIENNTFTLEVDCSSFPAYVSGGTATATGHGYMVRRYGVDVYNMIAGDIVTIDYLAGLDGESIPFFKLLILRAATREMQNMHDDVVGIKDLESRNVAPLDTGFTERELLSVKKYRRNRVA